MCAVTDRNGVVKVLIHELGNPFGSVKGNVNADVLHSFNRKRIHRDRMSPGARYVEAIRA